MSLSRTICEILSLIVVRLLGLVTINLYTKYEVSTFIHYKDMKGDEKCKN